MLASCRPCSRCTPTNNEEDYSQHSHSDRYPPYRASVDSTSSKVYQPRVDNGLPVESGEAYVALENGERGAEEDDEVSFNTSARMSKRSLMSGTYVLLAMVGSLITVLACNEFPNIGAAERAKVMEWALLGSIPIVACLFTWFHIWLAIQMMFKPLNFFGCCQCAPGVGLGWQGVVPRKAVKMAQTTYECGRPYLDGPRDWMNRVDARKLVAETRSQLASIVSGALDEVAAIHFPRTWNAMPLGVRRGIIDNALDRIQATSPELWRKITDLVADKRIGLDNDRMVVTVFTANKELLNEVFLKMGEPEFRFIEHCGALMGFVCGVVQLIAFNHLAGLTRAFFLPGTGFFLGIVSNWLAIRMCFRPIHKKRLMICCWHVGDIQGLFLKRQPEVAKIYAKILTQHFMQFDKILIFLQTQPELWDKLKAVYTNHNNLVMREALGVGATLGSKILGPAVFEGLEEDLKAATLKRLADATEMQRIASQYIGRVADIERRNRAAVMRMSPEAFENLLHPIFKEDEWMLILVGGVLGLLVGLAQVCFLK